MGIFDSVSEALNYIVSLFFSFSDFIFGNKLVFYFVFVPIIGSCIVVVIDMLFDIRDLFGDASKYREYLPYTKLKLYYHRKYKKEQLNMNEVYQRSKEHAEYKHKLKMEEAKEYRSNENIRHQHKLEEQDNFYKNKQEHDLKIKKMQSALNKHSIPKKPSTKKANLDVEVED